MRKYKYIPALVSFLVAIVLFMIRPIPRWIGLIFMGIGLIFLIYAGHGSVLFAKANKRLTERKEGWKESAAELYKKALNAGLPQEFAILSATMLIQYGDMERGKEELEALTKSKTAKIRSNAYNSLGMYYWAKRDLDKAISMSLKAKEIGLKDRNIYINLGTYYLYVGKMHEFSLLLKECYTYSLQSTPIFDLHAEYLIIEGDWERAGGFLKSIFDKERPAYVDPYLHFAVVYLHYGKCDEAIKVLKDAKKNCSSNNTSLLKDGVLDRIIKLLEDDDTRWRAAIAFDRERETLFRGEIPPLDESLREVPIFPELPKFKKESIKQEDMDAVDENDVNTNITEDDEKWLERHS